MSIGPRNVVLILSLGLLGGCGAQQLKETTVRTDQLVRKGSAPLAESDRVVPSLKTGEYPEGDPFPEAEDTPGTIDPIAKDLPFRARTEAQSEAEAIIAEANSEAERSTCARAEEGDRDRACLSIWVATTHQKTGGYTK